MADEPQVPLSDEPQVSWSFVEMLDASHQSALDIQDKSHARTLKILHGIIIGLIVTIIIMGVVIGVGIYEFTQYDVVSWEQDGDGNNIIGDNNRGYFNEPEIDYTPQEE